jgi:hypothetical protein
MKCAYTPTPDNVCGFPVAPDVYSPSGFSHDGGHGWQHWASPEVFGMGEAETDRILKPCAVCGKKEPDNEAHVLIKGHAFKAVSA